MSHGLVLPHVVQHVDEHVPHFTRRPQDAVVIAIRQHPPPDTEDPAHGARDPRPDGLHAPPERCPVVRFDQQMDVVALERVEHVYSHRKLRTDRQQTA
jgi:hypothetical protein